MSSSTSPFSFIDEYVRAVLDAEKITLTEEQELFYIPRLAAFAEQRLGADMMSKLSDEAVEQFEVLFSSGATTAEEWLAFWQQSIPNFQEEVQKSLSGFSSRVKELLAETQ